MTLSGDTTILNLSHLAKRALEDFARCPVASERRDDGSWDILMSRDLANSIRSMAATTGMSTSDWIISAYGKSQAGVAAILDEIGG